MNPLLSLHFSSAGKGPFMTSKAKNNYVSEEHCPGGGGRGGFRIHGGIYFPASCQPIDRKVFSTPQNKEFYEQSLPLPQGPI